MITRPWRFGKTLNMSIMAYFFDITKNSKEISLDTAIMKTKYTKEINQWPTIFISFARAKNTLENIIQYMKSELQNEYDCYEYIFTNMTQFEKRNYNIIIDFLMRTDNSLAGFQDTLSFSMKMLEKYYHKK